MLSEDCGSTSRFFRGLPPLFLLKYEDSAASKKGPVEPQSLGGCLSLSNPDLLTELFFPWQAAGERSCEVQRSTVSILSNASSTIAVYQMLATRTTKRSGESMDASCNIRAGEDVTTVYHESGRSGSRYRHSSSAFDFECACNLCTIPLSENQASDKHSLWFRQQDGKMVNRAEGFDHR